MELKNIIASLNNIVNELNEISDVTPIDDIISEINNKEFGFIGIHAYKNGNVIRTQLEEAKFGIDFTDDEDIKKYVKNEHEAIDYLENVIKPNLEAQYPEYTVVLPRNKSLWYDDPEYNG